MLMKPSSTPFITMMILGTMTTLSATSWFSVWLGMEMNIIGFIPLIIEKKNMTASESAMKYFIIQTISSSTLILFSIQNNFLMMSSEIINMALLIKLGAAPFHFWVPSMTESMSWSILATLLTWQKLAPLMALNFHNPSSPMIIITLISSALWGPLGGLTQTSTKKMLAFSSIAHISWILAASMCSLNTLMIYFLIYSLSLCITTSSLNSMQINSINMTLFAMKKNKILIYILMLNMGGMPPMIGFYPKLLVLALLIKAQWLLISMILIMSAMINLFFYLRLTYISLNITSSTKKNMLKNFLIPAPVILIFLMMGPMMTMIY